MSVVVIMKISPMMLTSETDFIYEDRGPRARAMIKDALSPRAILAVRRQLRRTVVPAILCASVLVFVSTGLSEDWGRLPRAVVDLPTAKHSANLATTYPELRAAISYKIVLSPHVGAAEIDRNIQIAQRRVKQASDPCPFLEQLGWLYVTKARTTHDQGFYKLAEQCALALEAADSKSPAALLLRGHVLISFHRFAEAEVIAKELVAQRTLPFDYGLLGDALVEQGRLAEAVDAYQRMVDLRPDLQSYSRVAYMRWLKGDLDGAIEVARLAARAASPLDPESASWSLTRLGHYYLQAGSLADAKAACEAALTYSANYPAALLLKSRFLLLEDNTAEATIALQGAVAVNPLPEFQWALADYLHSAGRDRRSRESRRDSKEHWHAQNDPRTFASVPGDPGGADRIRGQLAQRELRPAQIFLHTMRWRGRSLPRVDSRRHGLTWRRRWLRAPSTPGSSPMPGVIAAKLGRTTKPSRG